MTSSSTLAGRRIAILVEDLFEQAELEEPLKALRAAGATAHIVSRAGPRVTGMKHHERGDAFDVDVALDEARAEDYDCLVLPGGVVNADALRLVEPAQRFAQAVDRAGKPLAVICHGGWLLISSGLAQGRTLTSWPTLQDNLRNAGATWIDGEVVTDRNWTSSRKPDDRMSGTKARPLMAKKIADFLGAQVAVKPDECAAALAHLKLFWAPSTRRQFVELHDCSEMEAIRPSRCLGLERHRERAVTTAFINDAKRLRPVPKAAAMRVDRD